MSRAGAGLVLLAVLLGACVAVVQVDQACKQVTLGGGVAAVVASSDCGPPGAK